MFHKQERYLSRWLTLMRKRYRHWIWCLMSIAWMACLWKPTCFLKVHILQDCFPLIPPLTNFFTKPTLKLTWRSYYRNCWRVWTEMALSQTKGFSLMLWEPLGLHVQTKSQPERQMVQIDRQTVQRHRWMSGWISYVFGAFFLSICAYAEDWGACHVKATLGQSNAIIQTTCSISFPILMVCI